MSIFMVKSQPSISLSTPSTPPILPEIVFLFGHLSRVGNGRCWQLWNWEEVPATPRSKCFCFHFRVLVWLFFGFFWVVFFWEMWFLSFVWFSGALKTCLCVWITLFCLKGGSCFMGDSGVFSLQWCQTQTHTNIHMHTKWVTHSNVWFTAEFKWDLLWAWE